MGFQGADTTALREQACAVQECGKAMLERSSTLTSTVMSVAWVGPDADEMRSRWMEVDRQIRSRAEELSTQAKELEEHAEEQDAASQGDGGESGSLWERLGLPSLSDLFTNAGSRLSDAVGWARKLADAVAPGGPGGPGGPGSDNPLLAAMVPGNGDRTSDSLGYSEIVDFMRRQSGAGDADPASDSPFTHTPGTDSKESSVTVTGKDGDSITVSKTSESLSAEVIDAHRHEVSAGGGGASATVTVEKSEKYSVERLADGTTTYTFTDRISNSAEVSGDSKIMDLAVGKGDARSVTYSVTVPPGTKLTDALDVSPYDPSSIKPGYEVSIDTSKEQSTSVDGGIDLKRLPPLRFGAESTEGTGTTTQIARSEDGTLSLKAGPTEFESRNDSLGVGTKNLNFSMTGGRESKGATLEYAEFSDDANGNKAFRDAVRSGQLPDADSSAVTERYTETRRETTANPGMNLHAGNELGYADVSKSHNAFVSERITREYSDGRTEWDEQILPIGTDNGSWARASGGSDTETSYRLHMESKNSDDLSSVESYYGSRPSGDVDLEFSESELDQARSNAARRENDKDTNNEYAAEIVTLSQRQGIDPAVDQLKNDYNNFTPGPDGGTSDSDEVPGKMHR